MITFLYALAVWVGTGAFLAFLIMFVYYRGPKHMIDFNNYYGKDLGADSHDIDEKVETVFAITFFIAMMLLPMLAGYILYRDFVKYSIKTPVRKEKSNESD